MKVVLLTVYVHIVVLLAAFDIYFQSPIMHGMQPHKSDVPPPAKRVVVMIADGLRVADVFCDSPHVPHLSQVRAERGAWAVSHTRVPTESRPGHVAMLAGVYEDPSAITTGWQDNPVVFDSVLNQSRNTWAWGSPDILKLFNKEEQPHVHLDMYGADMQDFGKSTIGLDRWVFDRVRLELEHRRVECDEFCADGNLFVLHLLGMDTVGHASKPGSKEYFENLRYVDQLVAKTELLFEDFFNDNSTAYIFTADHGMTDWGSHGAGTANETETPFIAWGVGINPSSTKHDIQQADITPFIATLIGINIPVNSFGQLPYEFLSVNADDVAKMVYTNLQQLVELFRSLERKMQKHLSALFFVAYRPLSDGLLESRMSSISNLRLAKGYKLAVAASTTLIKDVLTGVSYYQNYFQVFLSAVMTFGFVLWIVYLFLSAIKLPKKHVKHSFNVTKAKYLLIPIAAVVVTVIHAQSLPIMFHLYMTFPFLITWFLFGELEKLSYCCAICNELGFRICAYVVEIFAMIQVFYWSTAYVFVLCGITVWVYTLPLTKPTIKFRFAVACGAVSLFSLLPTMQTQFNTSAFVMGALAWLVAGKAVFSADNVPQFLLLGVAVAVSLCVRVLDWANLSTQSLSWIILVVAVVSPLFGAKTVFGRLRRIVSGFLPYFFLLSMNYEVLFLLFYCNLLYQWIEVEDNIGVTNLNFRPVRVEDRYLRQAFFFLAFVLVGFFGTGNVASLNSFDPMWARCFVTVFSPFTMTGLILLKLFVPFIFASCAFRSVQLGTGGEIAKLFTFLLILTDVLVITFLHQIRNVGSWLDIGVSVSNFIIADAMVLVLLILYGLAVVYIPSRFAKTVHVQ